MHKELSQAREHDKILRKQYYFLPLFIFLLIGLLVSNESCKSAEADGLPSITEDAAISSEEAGNTEEAAPGSAGVVLDLNEGPDVILASYRDPVFQNGVIRFFQDLTGSRDVASVVLSNAALFNVSPSLAFALCWEESRYNPRALNRNLNNTVDRGFFS